ncbi:MAG: leucine-rich repeat domain-containing protein [Eubacterium sp.]|nr:leucine-rich repeat domain-containing protein [Eubacterium sp.]
MKHLRTDASEALRSKLRRLIADDAENMDEALAYDLEAQIILGVRAGFLSIDEIAEEGMEYISQEYPKVKNHISAGALQELVKGYWDEYANAGKQENYLKLACAFQKLNEQGIVALHCAGYVQSDGFDDCNEIASDMYENGENVIGCCFYTFQDLEHVLNEYTTKLRISFGNYFDKPTAVEVGTMIVKELEAAGFVTEWKQSADEKIAIKDMIWDKVYETNGNVFLQQFSETERSDFIIEHGVLKKYTGSDETVVIPDGITEIGPWAFKDCISLADITIPDSVSTIQYTAFSGCTNLSGVVLPDRITEIESWTFCGCSSLTSVVLPKGLKKIGVGSFMQCTSLVDITIPENVETICSAAFAGCRKLTGITIPDSVKSLDGTIFNGCTALASLILPANKYQISDVFVLSIDSKTLLFCIPGLATGDIAIPEGTAVIADNAFVGCKNLTGIHIPDSVKTIGNAAFYGCNGLIHLTLPAKVRKIDEAAFQMCTSLADLIIPDGVRKINKWTFCGCTSLKNVTIPDGVRKIDKKAFEDCDFTRLTICAPAGSYAEEFATENKFSFSAIPV